jgi:hypothetical protein
VRSRCLVASFWAKKGGFMKNYMKGYKAKPRFNPSFAIREVYEALGKEATETFLKIRQNSVVDYALHLDLEKTFSEVLGYVTIAQDLGGDVEVKLAAADGAGVLSRRILNNSAYAFANNTEYALPA